MKLLADPDLDFENAAEESSSIRQRSRGDATEEDGEVAEEGFLRCGRDLVESQLKTAD